MKFSFQDTLWNMRNEDLLLRLKLAAKYYGKDFDYGLYNTVLHLLE